MKPTAEPSLERWVAFAVDEAFRRHKKSLQQTIIEVLEDTALVTAMDSADRRSVSAARVKRLLNRRSVVYRRRK